MLRRNYKQQDNLDEEKIESDELSQSKVVSQNPSSSIDNICENIKTNGDLSSFFHRYFDKLGIVDKNSIEQAIYDMMETFKTIPLEISNSIPKILYDRV